MKENSHEHLSFEAYGRKNNIDLNMHPLHLLYLDRNTQLALKSFQAGYSSQQPELDRLNTEIEKLRSNAMPGGHGCCDICDTGGCCKAESEEE